ncbi:gliding motility-associated protein GldE [Luteibaculum oceani]|uniref:Gliding motility-associated protein GldE n=1 Tax=Luteibaculum oceani TaxID=1294296 RepID=A0A5C6VAF8_9FLAO|nr:gliding motility-associated protein GldE [Luteibaculum oceani]
MLEISSILPSLQEIDSGLIIALLVTVLLLFSSALISGSEVAYFSLSPGDIEELKYENSPRSNKVLELLSKPRTLLASILIANNFINIGIVLLSTVVLNGVFLFDNEIIAFVVQVVIATLLILIFGEVIPKVFASYQAKGVAIRLSGLLNILCTIFNPLSKVLVSSTGYLESRFTPKSNNISVDELEQALDLTEDEQSNEEEQRILRGIVKFGNTEVRQIMTARVDVIAVDISFEYPQLYKTIMDSGYSRIPVFEDNFDNIKGILYIKDLLDFLDQEAPDWKSLIREPYFIPETKKIVDLLKEFQERKIHMAVVLDEYGGTMGIITLEDVVEEIVGDISDEFDDDELVYSKIDDNTYVFEGKTQLVDIYKILEISGEEFEAASGDNGTIAGFVVEMAGKIPMKNEKFNFGNCTLTVEAADKRKVKRVKLRINNDDKNE